MSGWCQDVPKPGRPREIPALLKYHFIRMSVLCNLKTVWDEDLPSSGCDQIQEISNFEQGQLRLELMLWIAEVLPLCIISILPKARVI
jgi:hypothetical protein